MFRVLSGPFHDLANYLFMERQRELLASAYDNDIYYKIDISEKQYETITNDKNFLPNSYVSLNGVYATIGKDFGDSGTNTRYYIKIHLGGF